MNSRVYSIAGVVLIAFVALHALCTLFSEGNAGDTPIALAAAEAPDDIMGRSNSARARTVTQTHTVCKEGPPACDYTVIQEAVDATGPGDAIKVAAGVYSDVHTREVEIGVPAQSEIVTQVVLITKTIAIRGGYTTTNGFAEPPDPAANLTILDAQGQARVVLILQTADLFGPIGPPVEPLIAGFLIRGGYTSDYYGGGAICVRSADATIAHNHFADSTSSLNGGAISLWGGTYRVLENRFTSNVAGESGEGAGGGIYASRGRPEIRGNTFISNSANLGGAVALEGSKSTVSGNSIISNTALVTAGRGGGMAAVGYCHPIWWGECWWQPSEVSFDNNVVADNSGGGLFFDHASAILNHNTIAGHDRGIELLDDSSVAMTNTIIAGHSIGIVVIQGSSAITLEATLWGSGSWANQTDWAGAGNVNTGTLNIWDAPAFIDPDNGDYHIDGGSAARDAGLAAGFRWDVDGQMRPMGHGYDIGADEFPEAGLYLERETPGSSQNRGETITHRFALAETEFARATSVALTVELDAWQLPEAVSSTVGECMISGPVWGGDVVCDLGDLQPGARVNVTLTTELSSSAPLGTVITGALRATAAEAANRVEFESWVNDCHVRVGDDPTTYQWVQPAVDAASAGDEVKVAGTCLGVAERDGSAQLVFVAKDLTLRGGYTTTNWTVSDPLANRSLLDALNQGAVIVVEGPVSVTIEALSLTQGGFADDHYGRLGCVDVQNANLILRNNYIHGCSARGGTVRDSVSLIEGNRVISNSVLDIGGAGIYIRGGTTMLRRNVINYNFCESRGNTCPGGGLAIGSSRATLDTNEVAGNISEWGGGINAHGTITMTGNSVLENSPDGLFAGHGNVTLLNNVFAANEICGVYFVGDQARLVHNTFAQNDSGFYLVGGTARFTNTIIVSNTSGIHVRDGSITMEATLWGSGSWANGQNAQGGPVDFGTINIRAEPGFVNPDAGDYHLASGSAAIDRGIATAVNTDIDNDARPHGLAPDLGADEYAGFRSNLLLPLAADSQHSENSSDKGGK